MRDNHERPAGALEAAFDVYLTAAAENPRRSVVSGDGAAELLTALAGARTSALPCAPARRCRISSGGTGKRQSDTSTRSEAPPRKLAISYAALPKGPANMSAASVATLLGPYVESLSQPART